jgi:hypothetical protein
MQVCIETMYLKGVDVKHANVLRALSSGRGVQTRPNGDLVLRWIGDRWGNAWLDGSGDKVRYVIPCYERHRVHLYQNVWLVVRQSGVDYDTGLYTVTTIDKITPDNGCYGIIMTRPPTKTVEEGKVEEGKIPTETKRTTVSDTDSSSDSDSSSGSESSSDSDFHPDTDSSSEAEFVVQRIEGHKKPPLRFRVRWVGLKNRTWEPLRHFVSRGRINKVVLKYCLRNGLNGCVRRLKCYCH